MLAFAALLLLPYGSPAWEGPPAASGKRDSDEPDARIALVSVAGFNPADQLLLQQRQGSLRRCLRAPGAAIASDTFDVTMTIESGGQARAATAPGPVRACVAKELQRARFAPSDERTRRGVLTYRVVAPEPRPIDATEVIGARAGSKAANTEATCLRAAARRLREIADEAAAVIRGKDRAAWRQRLTEAHAAVAQCRGLSIIQGTVDSGGGSIAGVDCPGCKRSTSP